MSEPIAMSSNRPYLLRALYEWIGDNDMTPYLLVDAGLIKVALAVSDQAGLGGQPILDMEAIPR